MNLIKPILLLVVPNIQNASRVVKAKSQVYLKAFRDWHCKHSNAECANNYKYFLFNTRLNSSRSLASVQKTKTKLAMYKESG